MSSTEVRNNAINTLLSQIGAGTVGLSGNATNATNQSFTPAGAAALDTPNAVGSVSYFFARTVTAPANGFLVTETAPTSGVGSLVAWDFGDITTATSARLVVGYDIELFQSNGIALAENVATYLSIPEPASLALLGGASIALLRRRRA